MIVKFKKNLFLYVLLAASLGAAAGALVWALLRIMNLGIELVWHTIPHYVGNEVIYTIAVCLLGGLLIGLWQKKFGIYPEELEEVMHELRTTGTYPYSRIPVLSVAALLPLIFGGCLGPEAGLTGIIVGLCCWVGDRLKYKGREIREIAEAGMAATLGVIFASPFVGIAFNYESEAAKETEEELTESEKAALKKLKKLVYIMAVAGGLGAMKLLGTVFGGGSGIPRFGRDVDITVDDWKWFIAVFAAGLIAGLIYAIAHKITVMIGDKLINHRVISCMLAGLCLAVIGLISPWTMFSGEHQMGELMEVWQNETAAGLVLITVLKLVLVNLCIDLGWKGGHIFPVIFSGVSMGFAMAMIIGIEPVFAVAVTTAALCGYIMRKPVMVIGVLLLCFPVTVIIPLAAAAYLGSIIPVPFERKEA
ncbi:MAG: chloride channel protein [Firmicutes bacterium]|nr:chloride channel protein [Bacillota bacterium]